MCSRIKCNSLLTFVVLLTIMTVHACATDPEENVPLRPEGGVIKLFNGENLDGLYIWLENSKYEDPHEVFTIADGILKISGDDLGGLITKQKYTDYHMICEFKWGEKTSGSRKYKARDSGLLVHCNGPDGGLLGAWLASIEAQIIEGGVGDFLALSGEDPESGKAIPVTITAETTKDRDDEPVWKKGGEKLTLGLGRINWSGRDVDWVDELGFRGRDDVESPLGEWTRYEVICDGDTITNVVNGVIVNHCFDVKPSAGKVLLQSEGAEMFVRRWEIWPLGKAPSDKKTTK